MRIPAASVWISLFASRVVVVVVVAPWRILRVRPRPWLNLWFSRRIEQTHHGRLHWRRYALLFLPRFCIERLGLRAVVSHGLLLLFEFFASDLLCFFSLALDIRQVVAQRHLTRHKLTEMRRQVPVELFRGSSATERRRQHRVFTLFHPLWHHG